MNGVLMAHVRSEQFRLIAAENGKSIRLRGSIFVMRADDAVDQMGGEKFRVTLTPLNNFDSEESASEACRQLIATIPFRASYQ